MSSKSLQLVSKVTAENQYELRLQAVDLPEPEAEEVIVQVQAAPINPSDLALLIYPADVQSGKVFGEGVDTVYRADIPDQFLGAARARAGIPIYPGSEGAGLVVKAGKSAAAQRLLGKTVSALGRQMYAQYRVLNVNTVMELPADATAREGASAFVNPMTALSMVECMAMEGFSGIVHTAAASNLGRMLNKLCIERNIPLVNIVRRSEQEELLRSEGAQYVVDSSKTSFKRELTAIIKESRAYLCFDAIGGGEVASDILHCMEKAAASTAEGIGPYGSNTYKQVYIYGSLSQSPTIMNRDYGFSWGVGSWLLLPFLEKLGAKKIAEMQSCVMEGIKTTFSSSYKNEISLIQALQPDVVREYFKQSTGSKFIINPSL